MPAQWQAIETQAGLTPGAADLTQWWARFDDPVLTGLVLRAVTGNKSLREAEGRLKEARARRGMAAADVWPTLGVSGSGGRSGSSQRAGSGQTLELYSAGFDASWELDIFGGQRRAQEAAAAREQDSEADLADVHISLVAEVVQNYLDLRASQSRLRVTEANLASQQDALDLATWRAQAGLATQRDVDQAASALAQTRAQIPALRTGAAQALSGLAVLLGLNPQALPALPAAPVPRAADAVTVGIPADLLRRRPDLRRAERQLAAQTAEIGVAVAAQYPRFTLSGSLGSDALTAGTLFASGTRSFSLAGRVAGTLFDGGRLRQNVVAQTAVQEQLLARYEGVLLTALADVENAMTAYAREQDRRAALRMAEASALSAAALARDEYAAGLVDFQSVIDTQRSLLTLQDQLVTSDAQVAGNLVRLFKALGGGWTTPAMEALPPVTTSTETSR